VIFAIVGMDVHPFDRLARAVDALAETPIGAEGVFIQLGACTYEPKHARFERFLSFGEVCENIERSSAVITHAGAGSTIVCLQHGKRPIIVPRRARFAECVDEHQAPFARKLAESGLAFFVDDVAMLANAISEVSSTPSPAGAFTEPTDITRWLEEFWRQGANR